MGGGVSEQWGVGWWGGGVRSNTSGYYAPIYIVTLLFKPTYVGCMYSLAIACHLNLWQNDRSLLRATAVTRGVGMDTEIRIRTKS